MEIERLEDRLLLSGNVNAFVSGNDLVLIGDGGNNSVSITADDSGITVGSNDDTTINGGAVDFLAFAQRSAGDLVVDLSSGSNTFFVAGDITFDGSVRFVSQGGRDSFGIRNAQINGSLDIFTGKGADRVALRDVNVGNDVRIRTRNGFNVISARRVRVADDVEVVTETQNDFVVFDESQIGDDVRIFTGDGIDTIAFRDSSIGDHAEFFTGEASDFVSIDDTRIGNNSYYFLAGGDDAVNVSGTSRLVDDAKFFGDRGNDSIQTGGGTINADQFRFGSEFVSIDAAAVNDALTDPGGAFPKADVAQQILGTDDGPVDPPNDIAVTTDVSSNGGIQANGSLLVGDQNFVISGTTTPGATVDVDRDGNGQFNDGTTVADVDGNYSLATQLQNDGQGSGANVISVRSTLNGLTGTSDDIDVHFAEGTVVEFETSLGDIQVELLDAVAPGHVANFLAYQQRYTNSIVQRSVNDFIIQAGRFALDGNNVTEIQRDPVIDSEFTDVPNARGTLALALPTANPATGETNQDGGSSEYFFNVEDNATRLNSASQRFTVFGRVIGNGMQIVDAINDLPVVDLSGLLDQSALSNLPLTDYSRFTGVLTGTVSVSEGTDANGNAIANLTGTNTLFQSELNTNQPIRIGDEVYTVTQIDSDTSLQASFVNPVVEVDDATVEVDVAPTVENYVVINSITELQI